MVVAAGKCAVWAWLSSMAAVLRESRPISPRRSRKKINRSKLRDNFAGFFKSAGPVAAAIRHDKPAARVKRFMAFPEPRPANVIQHLQCCRPGTGAHP